MTYYRWLYSFVISGKRAHVQFLLPRSIAQEVRHRQRVYRRQRGKFMRGIDFFSARPDTLTNEWMTEWEKSLVSINFWKGLFLTCTQRFLFSFASIRSVRFVLGRDLLWHSDQFCFLPITSLALTTIILSSFRRTMRDYRSTREKNFSICSPRTKTSTSLIVRVVFLRSFVVL